MMDGSQSRELGGREQMGVEVNLVVNLAAWPAAVPGRSTLGLREYRSVWRTL